MVAFLSYHEIPSQCYQFNIFVNVPNEIKWGGEKRLIHLQAK